MSSDANASALAVALFSTFYTQGYCTAAATVLFIYDTFVTFDQEVACFWTPKWTGAPLLFFANKWISLAFYVLTLVTYGPFSSDKSCSVLEIALTAALILQFVPGAVFSALRAYVLSRSKLLGLLVLVLSLAPVGANLVPYGYQFSGKSVPPFGCLESADTSEAIDLRLILVSRVPLIIADMILIYVTWAKLRSRDALKDIRQSKKMSLSDVLFRDGTQYFVVLFILNVLHFVFSLTALAVTENGTSYLTVFTAPLTAILISRFLLDLQEANQAVVRVDSDNSSHSPSNPWNDTPSFISSLGAFINPDLGTQSDDELELQYVSRSDGEKELEGGVQVSDSQVAAASSSSSSAAAPSAMCA